jgi:hypothetical protein
MTICQTTKLHIPVDRNLQAPIIEVTDRSLKLRNRSELGSLWDNAVGIATVYGLDCKGVRVRVPAGAIFSPLHVLPNGFGARPASYPMVIAGYFSGRKAAGS